MLFRHILHRSKTGLHQEVPGRHGPLNERSQCAQFHAPFEIIRLTKYCVEKKKPSNIAVNPNIPATQIETNPKNRFPQSAAMQPNNGNPAATSITDLLFDFKAY